MTAPVGWVERSEAHHQQGHSMSDYRRWYVPGATYFFTVVTNGRRPVLTSDLGRLCLRSAITQVQKRFPFKVFAIVLLPDHLHTVWTLPQNDSDYSIRWGRIKELFTREFLTAGGSEPARSESRVRHRERAIWQRRFWEHTCRDENDLKRFVDYLHWNPRKHGLVARVRDYRWSTFHRFVRQGEYDEDWGGVDPCPDWDAPEWE